MGTLGISKCIDDEGLSYVTIEPGTVENYINVRL